MSVTIYHNDSSATSRAVVDLICQAGVEPVIIDYMRKPPSHEQMLALLLAMDIAPRNLLRKNEPAYLSLGLDDESVTDRQILDAMLTHPELIQRPIVLTDKGVKICRPAERVCDIL